MRYDAPFVVKRLSTIIGYPDGPRRVRVAHNAYTLDAALTFASMEVHDERPWRQRAPHWVERRGQSATRSR